MWIAGIVAAVLLVVVIAVWYTSYRARGRTPPPEVDEPEQAPPDRDRDWDPRARYDDEPPPQAR